MNCPACAQPNPPDHRFCGACGAVLQGTDEEHPLRDVPADAAPAPDAEELRSVVRAYQESASQAIERYVGHIARYLGDNPLV